MTGEGGVGSRASRNCWPCPVLWAWAARRWREGRRWGAGRAEASTPCRSEICARGVWMWTREEAETEVEVLLTVKGKGGKE